MLHLLQHVSVQLLDNLIVLDLQNSKTVSVLLHLLQHVSVQLLDNLIILDLFLFHQSPVISH